jgi:hypothetical protein
MPIINVLGDEWQRTHPGTSNSRLNTAQHISGIPMPIINVLGDEWQRTHPGTSNNHEDNSKTGHFKALLLQARVARDSQNGRELCFSKYFPYKNIYNNFSYSKENPNLPERIPNEVIW